MIERLPVLAHGIAGRADLPIPAELFGAGAAAVLVLSFAALAAGWSEPRLERPRERLAGRVPRIVEVAGGALGVALFAFTVYAGLAGTDVSQDNWAPTAVYVLLWVGVPVASLFLGDVFRVLSPWRALGRAAGAVLAKAGSGAAGEPLRYPERLGCWPAVVTLAAFALVELAWGRGHDPQVLAVLAVAYLVVQLAGMALFGVETWSRRGDGLGAYFSLFAALAPLRRRDDGTLAVRAPGVGAIGFTVLPGTVPLVLVAIAATTFDGAREGPLFGEAAPRLQDLFTGLGASLGTGLELAFAVGLGLSVLVVSAVYLLGVAGMPRGSRRPGAFVHSLLPIVAAYVVAHYFSLLAYQGQRAWALASDPLGNGSDLLGGAGTQIDYGVISATGIWYVQVAALVLGHVGALVLAHDRALVLHEVPRRAVRSQVAMLCAMVAFTTLGLWLLSVANA